MAELNQEQLLFLKSQKISPSMLLDASGLSKAERLAEMDALEKHFYYGGASCKSEGHTLRTKAGHCIQCDTSKIAYQLRNSASGYVYLAYSASSSYVKIGYSKYHPQKRGAFLRNEGYGNIRDWDVKKVAIIDRDAGKMEFLIHAALESFQKPIFYKNMNGIRVECREVFNCSLDHAVRIFTSIIEPQTGRQSQRATF